MPRELLLPLAPSPCVVDSKECSPGWESCSCRRLRRRWYRAPLGVEIDTCGTPAAAAAVEEEDEEWGEDEDEALSESPPSTSEVVSTPTTEWDRAWW